MPSQTFTYTNGTEEIFPVGAGIYLLKFILYGAAGGGVETTNNVIKPGGKGGQVSATLNVQPGEQVKVIVGGKGGDGKYLSPGGVGGLGYGKGGFGGASDVTLEDSRSGGGGGGGTAVIYGINENKLVAGAGAGGVHLDLIAGNGGWPQGSNGEDVTYGGKGGTQIGPGAGGSTFHEFEVPGTPGVGSDGGYGARKGGSTPGDAGGGGGGGFYGGGGGATSLHQLGPTWIYQGFPGGGGSSYYDDSVFYNFQYVNGANANDGSVVISWQVIDDINLSSVLSSKDVYLGKDGVTSTVTISGVNSDVLQDASITFQVFDADDASCETWLQQYVVDDLSSFVVESEAYQASSIGLYKWKVIFRYGSFVYETSCSDPSQTFQVHPLPEMTTSISPGEIYLGTLVTDIAILDGIINNDFQDSTTTFQVFGPDDDSCENATEQSVITNQGPTIGSEPFLAASVGTHRWKVTFEQDDILLQTQCDDPSQQFTVLPPKMITSLSVSGDVPLGTSVTSTAFISDIVFSPRAQVTFQVFGPFDSESEVDCQSALVFTSGPVTTTSQVTSDAFVTKSPGIYQWKVILQYDDLVVAETDCSDVDLRFRGTDPLVSTMLVPTVETFKLGEDIKTRVTVSNFQGYDDAILQFEVFGPFDSLDAVDCEGVPLESFPEITPIGAVTYSPSFTAPLPGIYQWRVTLKYYDYDQPSACQNPDTRFTVVEPEILGTLIPSQSSKLGEEIKAEATFSQFEGYDEATVRFDVFGPFNAIEEVNCQGSNRVFFYETDTVSSTSSTESDPFKPPRPGLYQWKVTLKYGQDFEGYTKCLSGPLLLTVMEPSISIAPLPLESNRVNLGAVIKSRVTLSDFEGFHTDDETNIRFQLFGPFDTADVITCQGTAVVDQTLENIKQVTTDSPEFIPPAPGFYQWRAILEYRVITGGGGGTGASPPYSKSTECHNTTAQVQANQPTFTSQLSSDIVDFGGKVKLTVTVHNFDGFVSADKATLGLKIFGPFIDSESTSCQGMPLVEYPPVQVTTQQVDSDEFEPNEPGFYVWQFSFRFLDYHYLSDCWDESLLFRVRGVIVTTELSATHVIVGQAVSLKVFIDNIDNFDDAQMVISVYKEEDCLGKALKQFFFSGSGDGLGPTTQSPPFFAPKPGKYIWHVMFEDSSWIVTTECSDIGQTFVVEPEPVMTSTLSSTSQTPVVGEPIVETVVFEPLPTDLTGATLTFTVYGPSSSSSSFIKAAEFVIQPVGRVNKSPPFIPQLPGWYKWETTFRQGKVIVVISSDDSSQWTMVRKAQPILSVLSYGQYSGLVTVKISDGFMLQTKLIMTLEEPASSCFKDICTSSKISCSSEVQGNGIYFIKCLQVFGRWHIELMGDDRNEAVSILYNVNSHHYGCPLTCFFSE